MNKHDANHHGHRRGTDQKYISVLELLGRRQLKDEAIIYTSLSPCEDIAAVEEEVKEQ